MRICSIIALLLSLVGFIPYIWAILRRETKPTKASWIIWAVLDSIVIAGMYIANTINGQIIGAAIGAWTIVVLSLKYGVPGWTRLDKYCLGGAALGIVLWFSFSNPVLGIITSLVVMFIGSIPTFVSAWKDPSREDKLAWTIYWFACVFSIIAIPRWTVADAAQPITFSLIQTTMMYILYIHKKAS